MEWTDYISIFHEKVDHIKSLGLTIDAQLSWTKHVDEICRQVSPAIGALKGFKTHATLYFDDYCDSSL